MERVDSLHVDLTGLIAAAEACQKLAADVVYPPANLAGTTATVLAAQLVYAAVVGIDSEFANHLAQQSETLTSAAAAYHCSDAQSADAIARTV